MIRLSEWKNNFSDHVVLDMGCGYSNVLEYFYKKGYGKMIGIDFCQ